MSRRCQEVFVFGKKNVHVGPVFAVHRGESVCGLLDLHEHELGNEVVCAEDLHCQFVAAVEVVLVEDVAVTAGDVYPIVQDFALSFVVSFQRIDTL